MIEADVSFHRDARSWVSEVRVIARYDGEMFALGFPREVRNRVYYARGSAWDTLSLSICPQRCRPTFKFHDFHREILLTNSEDLQITED